MPDRTPPRRSVAAVLAVVAACAAAAACAPDPDDRRGAPVPSSVSEQPPDTTSIAVDGPATTVTTASPPSAAVGAVRSDEGLILPVRAVTAAGWIVGSPCGEAAEVTGAVAVSQPRVVLDPGHGGDEEPGSVGANGLEEADVNLDVALRVKAWLVERGVSVQLTRELDVRMEIPTRAELVRALEPELFVSVHHNGGPTGPFDAPGTLAFHQAASEPSARLAGLLYEEVAGAMASLDLDWVAAVAPGAMTVVDEAGTDFFGMLRRTPGVPGVIIEALWITNPPEAEALADPAVLQVEAEAIGRAVLRHLTTDDPGRGFRSHLVFGEGAIPDWSPEACVDPPLS